MEADNTDSAVKELFSNSTEIVCYTGRNYYVPVRRKEYLFLTTDIFGMFAENVDSAARNYLFIEQEVSHSSGQSDDVAVKRRENYS